MKKSKMFHRACWFVITAFSALPGWAADRTEWYTPEVTGVLISAGGNVAAQDNFGRTPLHRAAGSNANVDFIRTLLRFGGDVSAQNEFGRTPLHEAARRSQNPEIIEILLAASADPMTRDNYNKLAVDYAAENEVLVGTEAYRALVTASLQ